MAYHRKVSETKQKMIKILSHIYIRTNLLENSAGILLLPHVMRLNVSIVLIHDNETTRHLYYLIFINSNE